MWVLLLLRGTRPFEVSEFSPNMIDIAGVLSAYDIAQLGKAIAAMRAESHIIREILAPHFKQQKYASGLDDVSNVCNGSDLHRDHSDRG